MAPLVAGIAHEVHGVVAPELKTPRKRVRKAVVVDTVYTPLNAQLMAELKAPAEGGPAPRVAFRCDPPARKGTRTCTVFQAQGTWAVELRGTDAGTWLVHALTFTAAN